MRACTHKVSIQLVWLVSRPIRMKDMSAEFPDTEVSYLNNASASMMPRSAVRAAAEFLEGYNQAGPDSRAAAEMVEEVARSVRRMVSDMLRCQPDEISITQSTTDGINAVAGGLDAVPHANIVMRNAKYEHHANVLPWLGMDLKVKMLEVDSEGLFCMEDLADMVDEDTVVVTLSHALYNTGAIIPLESVRRVLGDSVRLFVDAAQAVGCIGDYDYSRIHCDYMAFNGSKWLCGPMGTGLFYCSRQAASTLRPVILGGESAMVHERDDIVFKDGPGRFEGGFRNYWGVAGLEAALKVVLDAGLYDIRCHDMKCSRMLREGLEDMAGVVVYGRSGDDHIGIVSFNVEGVDPADMVKKLERRGVVMALREIGPLKMVRASPHFYNNTHDIERALQAVSDIS